MVLQFCLACEKCKHRKCNYRLNGKSTFLLLYFTITISILLLKIDMLDIFIYNPRDHEQNPYSNIYKDYIIIKYNEIKKNSLKIKMVFFCLSANNRKMKQAGFLCIRF